MKMLFSGRFDRPHLGHIITISNLMQNFDEVLVVVLDYKEQHHSVIRRVRILCDGLRYVNGTVDVISNKNHFGEITKEELDKLPAFDIYGSGNQDVLEHMRNFCKAHYVPRYPEFAASNERRYHKVMVLHHKIADMIREEFLDD